MLLILYSWYLHDIQNKQEIEYKRNDMESMSIGLLGIYKQSFLTRRVKGWISLEVFSSFRSKSLPGTHWVVFVAQY